MMLDGQHWQLRQANDAKLDTTQGSAGSLQKHCTALSTCVNLLHVCRQQEQGRGKASQQEKQSSCASMQQVSDTCVCAETKIKAEAKLASRKRKKHTAEL